MKTERITVDAVHPDAAGIARAADVIRRGGLVAFPTETVYGLGGDALDAAAVLRIFEAKGRPSGNPIIVHSADADAARALAGEWPRVADRLADHFWPGPLTLVVWKPATIPDAVTAGGPTVGLRVPSHAVAAALLRESGRPIAAPSANRAMHLSPTLPEHVLKDLDGRIDLLLDGGPTMGGIESTVVDVTVTPPQVLRPGPVSRAMLEDVIGRVELHRRHGGSDADALSSAAGANRAPGMTERHYAPQTPLVCVEQDDAAMVGGLASAGRRVGWLALGAARHSCPAGASLIEMPADAGEYGRRLYAALHALDSAGLDVIVVAMPPESDAFHAIRDRLRRAAGSPSGHP
ncbi:Threonylcarbamoyl-AMP synthase [Phycisphaerae bacterium RAS1]|nr:Threonylcarbamoyl-AMP synthase [Phycisphaerae bacterium RAS1]